MAQSALNYSPSPKHQKTSFNPGIAPIIGFAQLPANYPVLTIFNEYGPEETLSLELVEAHQLFQYARIASEIDQVHQSISVSADQTLRTVGEIRSK